ncbi:MAG: hypothetical protein LBF00_02190 [Mycoplasmataceae bacterium]|nr:hypothetical protein [Mycoplasmataceae bacterium]
MKKEGKILKADHNPVKVGDNVLLDVKSKKRKKPHDHGPGPDTDDYFRQSPKPPAWFAGAIQAALEPLKSDVRAINTRLNKQDEFNKVVTDYMKSHP